MTTGRVPGFMLATDNPMRPMLLSVLLFEVVVFGLAVPVMIFVSGVPGGRAAGLGVAAMVLALVSAALLRRPVGYALGWLTQVAGIALGLATWIMFFVGGMFAGIWVLGFVLGRRLQARQAAGGTGADRVSP